MAQEKLTPELLADCSKAVMIDAVMTFVDQVSEFTEQNSLVIVQCA